MNAPPHRDVEQMRREGYDPSTIEEAEAYNARWDALFASPIGEYFRKSVPDEVEEASGVRLLPLVAIAEGARELAPDKLLFDEGFAPIASSVGGNCIAYDPKTEAFYWADHARIYCTDHLVTPSDYRDLPYSAENLRKVLVLISRDPVDRFITDLRTGAYEKRLDELD